jgi:alcohol dehydrogenase class IV
MERSYYRIDKMSTFLSPNKILLGVGATGQVGKETKFLGAKKVLIVTDKGVLKARLLESIKESLQSEGIDICVFDGVEAEPPARVVNQSAQIAQSEACDVVIGVGGGSSLDVAKGAAIMATNKGEILDYVGINLFPKRGLPTILIPTTAGTGSEVSRALIITDERDMTKRGVLSDFILSNVAVVDPLLTVSLPQVITAETGIDALSHAIEAYVSVNATPFSDILAIEAIQLVAGNLLTSYSKGGDVAARFNMMLASTLAGMAFTSGGLGAVHGLAYVIGTEYHLPHGRSIAIMLPHVMDYNKIGNLSKYARIAQAMGENIQPLSTYEAAEKSVDALRRLLESVNISVRLSDYGSSEADIPRLAEIGMKQTRLFVPNPRDLVEEDLKNIFLKGFRD